MGLETIPSGRRCQANILACPKYRCKSQLLSHFAAPLRSDNGSSRNATTAQAEMHAVYGISSHTTRYNGRHQGRWETIPSGRRCQANVLVRRKYLCKSQLLSHFAAPLRSDICSSRNAITAQAETHAGYGITSHSTRYNGRHQGGRETIPSGRRC